MIHLIHLIHLIHMIFITIIAVLVISMPFYILKLRSDLKDMKTSYQVVSKEKMHLINLLSRINELQICSDNYLDTIDNDFPQLKDNLNYSLARSRMRKLISLLKDGEWML